MILPQRALLADVPTEGVQTIHARFGDWLGWLSAAMVLGFVVLAILRGRSASS